eukprot:Clim_evm45s134 gene=Clim_evmTU45s134
MNQLRLLPEQMVSRTGLLSQIRNVRRYLKYPMEEWTYVLSDGSTIKLKRRMGGTDDLKYTFYAKEEDYISKHPWILEDAPKVVEDTKTSYDRMVERAQERAAAEAKDRQARASLRKKVRRISLDD